MNTCNKFYIKNKQIEIKMYNLKIELAESLIIMEIMLAELIKTVENSIKMGTTMEELIQMEENLTKMETIRAELIMMEECSITTVTTKEGEITTEESSTKMEIIMAEWIQTEEGLIKMAITLAESTNDYTLHKIKSK